MNSQLRRLAHSWEIFLRCAGAVAVASAGTLLGTALQAPPKPAGPPRRGGELQPVDVVGGHGGMLAGKGLLYKPADGRRGEAELRFYQAVFGGVAAGGASSVAPKIGADTHAGSHGAVHGSSSLVTALAAIASDAPDATNPAFATAAPRGYDHTLPTPARFMPRFCGVAHEADPVSGTNETFLVLEDLTAAMDKPCLLDIKMGVQTWSENASPAKVEQERRKWPPQAMVGYRYTGMRVWEPKATADDGVTAGRWVLRDRSFGYALPLAGAARGLECFLWDGSRVRVELIPPILSRLREIRAWFETQSSYRFYGSSLLFLYDGALEGTDAVSSIDVRMIDFPHVSPGRDGPDGRDTGYLQGLNTIIAQLEALLAQEAAVEVA